MMELAVAALFGFCLWTALLGYRNVDPVVAFRVENLIPPSNRVTPSAPLGLVRRILAGLGKRFPGTRAAGTDHDAEVGAEASVVRGAQLALGSGGFIVGLTTGVGALIVSPVLVLLGYRMPLILLKGRARRRRDQISAALPDAVDLLAVCAQAGLSIAMSLHRVADRMPGPLGAELRRTVEEIDLGIPRSQALTNLAKRAEIAELESLVGVLVNAERFGIGVSGSLQTFSEEMRIRRRQAAEEQARRAPVKMLFPLVFLILPAFILLTVVPMLMSAFASLSF